MFGGNMTLGGTMTAKKVGPVGPGFAWHLRNRLRRGYWLGWFYAQLAQLFSQVTGIPTITSNLAIRVHRAGGQWIDYGIVSYRLVTDAGVAFIVDDWDNSGTDISTLNYHGCGTGTNAEAAADTALQTESTTALNPDSTRATGTRSQPTAPQYRSVGTLTFDAGAAVTEHGLFSQAATGGGTLWDRSVFSVITVASGDSVQFTYTVSLSSGG